jgi:DNA topoisomerase VI subunit A
LLITAKGFPDLATRELLALIHATFDHRHNLISRLPMFCLVDNDPYGLAIYGVYKYGSEKNSHIERERLALSTLEWLGVSCNDFRVDDQVIALTPRDQRKIEVMLQKEWVQGEPKVWYNFVYELIVVES